MDKSKEHKTDDTFKMTGDWKDQSRQLKNKYPKLTDEDLKYEVGKENELIKKIEKRLDKSHDEVVNIIKKHQPVKI